MNMFQFDAEIPKSLQWNTGVQVALPWASAHRHRVTWASDGDKLLVTDGHQCAGLRRGLPAAEPESHARADSLAGATALPTNFYRPFQGFGAINRTHDGRLQRFPLAADVVRTGGSRDGFSFTFNYTLSRNKGTAGNGMRITRDASNDIVLRDDDHEANYHITANDRTHVGEGQLRVGHARPAAVRGVQVASSAAVDQRLAAVGDLLRRLRRYLHGRLQLPGGIGAQNLTGTPNYNARIVIVGDPGKRLLERLDAAVQHRGVPGAAAEQPGHRVGLELHERMPR